MYRRGLVRSFQVPRLWKSMTVVENLAVAARNAKGESLVEALFRRRKWVAWERKSWSEFKSVMSKLNILSVGLNRADNISGGQMKLTDIGRALVGEARILLLDEPTAGVAPKLARDIFKLLEALNREGLTVFVIEHRLEVLFDFVERVIVMHEGRVLVEGTPQQVAEDPRVIDAYLGS
ncbi:MAG TPA: ABC transporter ATP-binding protein [Pyrodictium sp.]|nr:ABC transporter ATP-binding protein [Pyrodictium sp.]